MHVFLYEWITGGGLIGEPGPLPPSLLQEGTAMARALAADFAKLPHCRVSLLRDVRLDTLAYPGCDVIDVQSIGEWHEEFDRLSGAADWSLAVAPEFDQILERTTQQIASACGRTLNAPQEFTALAANKQLTAERWQHAGVPTPRGVILAEGETSLPVDFTYPAVLKPVDGAGSQDVCLVASHRDEPPPYAWARRLEEFRPGRPASVAALCNGAIVTMLPACTQRLSNDSRLAYLGGALMAEPALAERASLLVRRALTALPPARGFVGVDLVLGSDANGDDDVVIEVNPRVTTSYVGLRQAIDQNLAEALLRAVTGESVEITIRNPHVEFAADGATWVNRR